MKIKFKFPKFSFRTITSGLFLLIILAEIVITFNYLYKNLQDAAPPVTSSSDVIRADLKGYSQVYNDLNNRAIYAPNDLIYQNPNPFKFGATQ
jgi:hypothetical protein